jgi:hypothetical protein
MRFPHPFYRACALLLAGSMLTLGALGACGSDGTTPDCPELPEYDVRDVDLEAGFNADLDPNADPDDPWVQHLRALREAADAGCITFPMRPPPTEAGTD